MSKKNGIANPARLNPADSDDDQLLRVVIETPKGSRNKFAFNAKERIFELKKVLPSGMAFPYDFGFVPSTLAGANARAPTLMVKNNTTANKAVRAHVFFMESLLFRT